MVALVVCPFIVVTAAAQPSPGAAFSYAARRWVGGGGGEYEGYSDNTWSSGRYEITAANATHATVHAVYSWRYSDTEGRTESGAEDRVASFAVANRLYTSARTDLDEYDLLDASTLAAWFWIPPEVHVGDVVQILDDSFAVTSLDATVWTNFLPKKGIEVIAIGQGARQDSYGDFTYRYTDTYYFDRSTGLVIAERYREHNEGFWQGGRARFDWSEDFDVTAVTYAIPTDFTVLGAAVVAPGAIVASVGGLGYAARWRTRTLPKSRDVETRTKVFRIRETGSSSGRDTEATEWFGPFLADWARKAILAKDVVALATSGSRIVGFGMYNREAKIGTVLCPNLSITETLRKFVGAKDFFSEVRHTVPEDVRKEALQDGVQISQGNAYNVFETYEVLRLEMTATERYPYDVSLVSRMRESDLSEVSELARRVYRVRSRRWLRAQIGGGDVGLVARVNGRIVGFALATCLNGRGRVHTLTVQPEFRNRGIGKELMRARLAALQALGATEVFAEIAHWNLPSLQIAWSHGFRPVGTMYVETARTSRIKRDIVRR